jgi:hypothetical protein
MQSAPTMLPQAPESVPRYLLDFCGYHGRELALMFEAVDAAMLGGQGDFWEFVMFCYQHTA